MKVYLGMKRVSPGTVVKRELGQNSSSENWMNKDDSQNVKRLTCGKRYLAAEKTGDGCNYGDYRCHQTG